MSKKGEIMTNIKFPKNKKAGCASLLAGLFGFFALITINYAFTKSNNIGYTVALISTTILITLIISCLFFNKPLETRGIIGILTILIGVYLISTCNNKSDN